MSYSRRQLYAMGEPLGDSVTRKEGGRVIYGSGGGGGDASQTQVTDLPEWAKPYAQKTLGQAEALTTTKDEQGNITGPAKYQTYDKNRIAGFQPLQEQAFGAAGALTPSQSTQAAQGVAGLASLGALGTNYDPYQTGQFTSGTAAQYMSPFIMNAMAPQLREAARQSDIQRNAEQARAVGQNAFGGSRSAIVEAERQRNLGQLQEDITGRGLQTAFQSAQDQFNREQQLREQSRQYGAGLGMQGFQTALQGANVMGQLGGQQFGQQKDIIGLQSTLGAQQQQQEQAKLSQDYQDFLNAQRFPYQQVEFMSNILRGTPMGSVSSLYAGQPNTLGQVAGIGAGLYGTFGRASGGSVSSYADGGSVTSDQNVEDILGKLSDQQLMQAKQIAMAQRNMERVQMIDAELAERASVKSGLGSAFNALPPGQQDAVTEMAGGGIVAFAGGGLSEEDRARLAEQTRMYIIGAQEAARQRGPQAAPTRSYAPVPSAEPTMGDPMGIGGQEITDVAGEPGRSFMDWLTNEPAWKSQARREAAAAPAPVPGVAPMTASQPTTQTYTRRGGDAGPGRRAESVAKAAPAVNKGIQAAAQAVGAAAEAATGVKRTSMEDAFKQGLAMMRDEQGEADSKRMVDLINKISKVDAPDKMEMLANFGFKMAAAASKPGARFLSAAAEGAQVVPEMMAQYKKDVKEANKLSATLEMEKLKYDAAVRKGDRSAALQHAQNIRVMEGQEAQLGLQREQLAVDKAYKEGSLRNQQAQTAAQQARYKAVDARQGDAMMRVKSAIAQRAMTQAAKDWGDPLKGRDLKKQYPDLPSYQKSLFNTMWAQSMPTLQYQGTLTEDTE